MWYNTNYIFLYDLHSFFCVYIFKSILNCWYISLFISITSFHDLGWQKSLLAAWIQGCFYFYSLSALAGALMLESCRLPTSLLEKMRVFQVVLWNIFSFLVLSAGKFWSNNFKIMPSNMGVAILWKVWSISLS